MHHVDVLSSRHATGPHWHCAVINKEGTDSGPYSADEMVEEVDGCLAERHVVDRSFDGGVAGNAICRRIV